MRYDGLRALGNWQLPDTNSCCNEKQARLVVNGLSVLRQMGERLHLPTDARFIEESVALARAQRRVLRAVHKELEADPLLAHLLRSRISYRKADENRTKSGKRLEEICRLSFVEATGLGFTKTMEDWRELLIIYPRQ